MKKIAVLLLSGVAAASASAGPIEIAPEAVRSEPTSLAGRWFRTQMEAQQDTRKVMPPWETLAYSSGFEFPQGPINACYAKDTPMSVIENMEAALGRAFGPAYQNGNGWNGTAVNTVATIRWSFVPDGLSIPSGVGEATANSILFSRMDTLAARATWIAKFQQCFDRWGAMTGLTYIRVQSGANPWDDGASWGSNGADGLRGDVRISMKNIDGGNGILAYNSFPPGGDMVIDSSEGWGSTSNDFRFLRNTVMHEHGHGIGLFHVCPINNTKLMEPFLATNFDGPQQDDSRGGAYMYGDAYEPNGTIATASPVGALSVGGNLIPSNLPGTIVANTSATSAANGFDTDYYSFTTTQNMLATVTVLPMGTTYLDGPQNGDGSCSAGTNINALAMSNLTAAVYHTNMSTQLGSSNTAAAGASEVLANVLISPPGTFYARVTASAVTAGESQLYRITINGTSLVTLTASDLTFPDKVRLNWTTIPGAAGYRIFRGTTTNFAGALQIATTGFANPLAATYDDTTAVPGTQYYYWVEAGFLVSGTTYRYSQVGAAEPGSRFGTPCTADFNGDTVLDFFDYLDFVDAFSANDISADFNGDTTVDFFDYLDFVDAYSSGC